MPFFDHLSLLLHQYDELLKVLAALAAPGGIWFWADKYRNRIRIVVRNISLPVLGPPAKTILLEVENVTDQLTSVEPTIRMIG